MRPGALNFPACREYIIPPGSEHRYNASMLTETTTGPAAPTAGGTGPSLDAEAYCKAVLPRVSRTFAVSIETLPGKLREPVRISYLFCRIADTLEDCPQLAAEDKQQLLGHFIDLFDRERPPEGIAQLAAAFRDLRQPVEDSELVRHAALVFQRYDSLPATMRVVIARWVRELAAGMKQTAAKKAQAADGLVGLETEAELSRYCYHVAGTVGHLLCGLWGAACRSISPGRFAALDARAEAFGEALQRVNLLKDIADDQARGWCYMPRSALREHGLAPGEYGGPEKAAERRAFVEAYICRTMPFLEKALEYLLLLPRRQPRIRLFCAWPLFFAVATLDLARQNPEACFSGRPKVKLSRPQVRAIMRQTIPRIFSNRLLVRYYRRLAQNLPRAT